MGAASAILTPLHRHPFLMAARHDLRQVPGVDYADQASLTAIPIFSRNRS